MTKRLFLKLAAMFSILPSMERGREYIKTCRWDELVGVRFEWPDSWSKPNPCPGSDWEIVERAESVFEWRGVEVCNYWMNKFFAAPVTGGERELLWFGHPIVGDNEIAYDLADLTQARFYVLKT